MKPPRGYRAPEVQANPEGADVDPILVKMAQASTNSFRSRFPGQLEHCQRLVAERLQAVLTKTQDTDLTSPDSWSARPEEIYHLTHSLMMLTRMVLDLEPVRDYLD